MIPPWSEEEIERQTLPKRPPKETRRRRRRRQKRPGGKARQGKAREDVNITMMAGQLLRIHHGLARSTLVPATGATLALRGFSHGHGHHGSEKEQEERRRQEEVRKELEREREERERKWRGSVHLQGYQSGMEIPVAWGEQDAFGHVNNVVYIRYFESTRIAFFQDLFAHRMTPARYAGFIQAKEIGPILSKVSCSFKSPVVFPDSLLVASRLGELGKDRFVLLHRVVSRLQGRVVADGESTIVTYDYRIGRKAEIPDDFLEILKGLK